MLVALQSVLDEAVDPMQPVYVRRRRFVFVMGLVQRPDQRADMPDVRCLVAPVSHADAHDISFRIRLLLPVMGFVYCTLL